MIRMEKERYVDGNYNAVLDLQVSTVAELPDKGDTIGLYTIAPGSIAQIIQADEPTFVTLDDDGTWYPEQSDSSASTLSAPNLSVGNIDRPSLGSGKSVLVQDEPEQTEPEQYESYEESIEEPEREVTDDADIL